MRGANMQWAGRVLTGRESILNRFSPSVSRRQNLTLTELILVTAIFDYPSRLVGRTGTPYRKPPAYSLLRQCQELAECRNLELRRSF